MIRLIGQLAMILLTPMMALSWPLCACAAMQSNFTPDASQNLSRAPSCCVRNHSNDHHSQDSQPSCPHCSGSANAVMESANDLSSNINFADHVLNPILTFEMLDSPIAFHQPLLLTATSKAFTPPVERLRLHCALLI